MQYDVKGERIIFVHPHKLPSHIKYSKTVGVEQMTVDSEFKMKKIKELFLEAKWARPVIIEEILFVHLLYYN